MSRHMEYNLFRRNKKTAQFYVSKEWRAMRGYILSRYDGLDLYAFHVQHRIATADMVHHIVEIEDDWNRRLTDTAAADSADALGTLRGYQKSF